MRFNIEQQTIETSFKISVRYNQIRARLTYTDTYKMFYLQQAGEVYRDIRARVTHHFCERERCGPIRLLARWISSMFIQCHR